jgi:hypothetical protein
LPIIFYSKRTFQQDFTRRRLAWEDFQIAKGDMWHHKKLQRFSSIIAAFSTKRMGETSDTPGEDAEGGDEEDDEVNRLLREDIGDIPDMVMINNARNMAQVRFSEGGGEEETAAAEGAGPVGDDQWLHAAPNDRTRRLSQAFYSVADRNARIRGISFQAALDEIERGIPQGLAPDPDSNLKSKIHTARRPSNEGKIGMIYNTKKKKKQMKDEEVRKRNC